MTTPANVIMTEADRVRILQALNFRNERAISRLVTSKRNTKAYRDAKEEIDAIALQEFSLRMPMFAEPDEIVSR